MRTILPIAALLALPLAACTSNETKSETAAPTAQAAETPKKTDDAKPAADEKADGAKKVKVVEGAPAGDDDRYDLKIETPEAESGKESKVTVRVVPREPWHMNLDFPTSLEVDAPESVTLAKAKLKKDDAAKLDDSACQFDVAFTPSAAGDQSFSGKFKFAVCQDEACSPVTKEIEFKVAVK